MDILKIQRIAPNALILNLAFRSCSPSSCSSVLERGVRVPLSSLRGVAAAESFPLGCPFPFFQGRSPPVAMGGGGFRYSYIPAGSNAVLCTNAPMDESRLSSRTSCSLDDEDPSFNSEREGTVSFHALSAVVATARSTSCAARDQAPRMVSV
jgi:hypothetical protein